MTDLIWFKSFKQVGQKRKLMKIRRTHLNEKIDMLTLLWDNKFASIEVSVEHLCVRIVFAAPAA